MVKSLRFLLFLDWERREEPEAVAGDIVMIAGLPDIYIGETICSSADQASIAGY